MVTGPLRHTIIIEKSRRNYEDYVPRLTGCVPVGTSKAEAVRKIQGALRLQIESLLGHHKPAVVDVVAFVGHVKDRSSGFGVKRGGRLE